MTTYEVPMGKIRLALFYAEEGENLSAVRCLREAADMLEERCRKDQEVRRLEKEG